MKRNEYDPIKEDVWGEIRKKYPDSFKVFSEWIDLYKMAVNWDYLFANTYTDDSKKIKFHHIPQAMQLGIWIQFCTDQGGCSWEIDDMFEFDLEEELFHWFASKQLEFDKDGNDL